VSTDTNQLDEQSKLRKRRTAAWLLTGVVAFMLAIIAAQQLLNQIAPYYGQLGHVAAVAVSSLLTAYTGLTIPPSLIVAAGGSIAGLIQQG